VSEASSLNDDAKIKQAFKDADVNHDGQIDYPEAKAYGQTKDQFEEAAKTVADIATNNEMT
jgi:Ca2+-binding EF-hand superfamily protein